MKHDPEQVAATPKHIDYRCRVCCRPFRVMAGTSPAWPEDCGGHPPEPHPARATPGPPLIDAGAVPTVPIREQHAPHSFQGLCRQKPWDYQVTVALPCLDHAEETAVVVALLRAQTVRPYFVLVDTGSTPQEAARLDAMRAADLEVHRIAANGTRYSSDLVAYALDLAFSRADTPYVFCTHQDCFCRRRDFLEYLIREIRSDGGHAVVGWQLTPRWHADWRQHFGHTATLFDLAQWDAIGCTWSLRRAMRDGPKTDVDPDHRGVGVWPDTESTMNTALLRSKARTKFLGTEANGQRNKDEWIDHVRSLVCGSLYCPERHAAARAEMVDAIREARARLAEWRGDAARGCGANLPATAEQIEARHSACRRCEHARTTQLPERLHPSVYCAEDLNSSQCGGCITRAVGYWQSRVVGCRPCDRWPE